MKKIILFLIFYCFSLFTHAQKDYSYLLHKTYPQRCRLLDSLFYPVNEDFDTAVIFKELNQIKALAQQENDQELYFETVFIKLRFTCIGKNGRANEAEIQSLIAQADKMNFLPLQVQARALYGRTCNVWLHNSGAAIEQYLNAWYLMKDVPPSQFPDKRDYVYNDLATNYYQLGDYDNAKKFLEEADRLPVYPVPRFSKMRGVINLKNTLGLIYRNTGRYDSAEYYFKKAYTLAGQENDTIWVGIAGGNIGITYFLQKRYTEAIPLLENDVRLSIAGAEYGNAANSLLKLVEINLDRNDIALARRQMLQARELIALGTNYYLHLDDYYPLMARLFNAEGNMAMAYRYADSSLSIKDTVNQIKSAVSLARAQQKTDIEHHKLEVQELEHRQKMQTIVRNGLLAMLALLAAITLLLINRQRLLKKQKQFAEAQQQQAQKELTGARQQLQNFTLSIREKNELVERLTVEMNELQTSHNKDAINYRRQTLEQLRQSTILTEDAWESFKASFEKVYPDWFYDIHEKLPGLSAADLRFLALTKLKLDAREMASVLGISPASLRMSRHRLRKKYNLTEEESLELLTESV